MDVCTPLTLHDSLIYLNFIEHSNDCGVYVCRYIYAMLRLTTRAFTYRDAGFKGKRSDDRVFKTLITDGDEFKFVQPDITRIRGEFFVLLKRLSEIFLLWKESEVTSEVTVNMDK